MPRDHPVPTQTRNGWRSVIKSDRAWMRRTIGPNAVSSSGGVYFGQQRVGRTCHEAAHDGGLARVMEKAGPDPPGYQKRGGMQEVGVRGRCLVVFWILP